MRNACIILILLSAVNLRAHEGVPFLKNYSSAEHGGHNRNFDVVSGKDGMTYFANFEGVLSFDNSTWHITYAPGYSRITRLFIDSKGEIWAGGYNIIAKVETDGNRRTILKPLVSDTGEPKIGEILSIFEKNGRIFFSTNKNCRYEVSGDSVLLASSELYPDIPGNPYNLPEGFENMVVNHSIRLSNGWKALATQNNGLVICNDKGRRIYTLTDANGLCSNSIHRITEDVGGCIWGVTDNGIFRVFIPSAFSHYTPAENLKDEVTSIQRYRGQLYIGTLHGLYVAEEGTVKHIPAITQGCWQLLLSADDKLYAATSEGVFSIEGNTICSLTSSYASSIASEKAGQLYIGEMDGIYQLSIEGQKKERHQIANLDRIMQLSQDSSGGLIAKSLSGDLYYKKRNDNQFVVSGRQPANDSISCKGKSYTWYTDSEGKNISVFSGQIENQPEKLNECLSALRKKKIRVIYPESDSLIWLGGDFGLIRVDFMEKDAAFDHDPHVYIREVGVNTDSILFGGIYQEEDWDKEGKYRYAPLLESTIKSISFRFSSDAMPIHRNIEYQYLLEGYDDAWSSWTEMTEKAYTNLFYGSYIFKVRAKDSFGRSTTIKEYPFVILWPFYLKWYSILFYVILFAFFVFLTIRWRLRRLVREKAALEKIVDSRTRQVVEQKNEIQEKSENLEKALSELRHAQVNLVRQEKMATVGKLTKGLIDRILNPLNYINNFSHLSSELAGELRHNLRSAETCMDRNDYDDSMDILDMMASNLRKIEEHGGNTSRILKAMEEVLKDRNRQKGRMDIVALCRQSLEMLRVYYKEDISRMNVTLQVQFPHESLLIEGNEELLGKTLMSLLNNGMYAISKKYGKQAYSPEIGILMETGDGCVSIYLKDNGIGIEESILEQIFDPFFTTKTTGEAAGVGLYLSKEIINNHNGSIQVHSRKDEYTEFIIKLPMQ